MIINYISIVFVLAICSVSSCKSTEKLSEEKGVVKKLFGKKEKLGPANSSCNQMIKKAKGTAFGKLSSCAVKNKCLKAKPPVRCVFCEQNRKKDGEEERHFFGFYHYPANSISIVESKIKICEKAINSDRVREYDSGLYEEVYHALSICAGGTAATDSLTKFKTKINNQVSRNMFSKAEGQCRSCLADEMLAKHCAEIQRGNAYDQADINFSTLARFNMAITSCRDYCTYDFESEGFNETFKHPTFKAMVEFYPKMESSCAQINKSCGVQHDR